MKISVLITTYLRSEYLKNCIKSIFDQSRPPEEIIVVYRSNDNETQDILDKIKKNVSQNLRFLTAQVNEPGVIAANNIGMKKITGDILVFIDDDAVAERDWLSKIERYYLSDSKVGAVGGRDMIHKSDGTIVEGYTNIVGKLTWYGKFSGGHHLQTQRVKKVDVLKGCNMSFRYTLIESECDVNFIGDACNYETDLCFQIKRKGYKIIFDSTIMVHHFVAPRYLPGGRDMLSHERLYYSHHNHGYVLLKNLTFFQKIIFFLYFFLFDPVKWLLKLKISQKPVRLLSSIIRGKKDAIKTYLKYKRNRKFLTLP